MQKTETKSAENNSKEVSGKTLSTALLKPGSEPPKATETSRPISVNLAEHLYALAKKVVQDEVTPATVGAACKCASEIHKLLDLQWRSRK